MGRLLPSRHEQSLCKQACKQAKRGMFPKQRQPLSGPCARSLLNKPSQSQALGEMQSWWPTSGLSSLRLRSSDVPHQSTLKLSGAHLNRQPACCTDQLILQDCTAPQHVLLVVSQGMDEGLCSCPQQSGRSAIPSLQPCTQAKQGYLVSWQKLPVCKASGKSGPTILHKAHLGHAPWAFLKQANQAAGRSLDSFPPFTQQLLPPLGLSSMLAQPMRASRDHHPVHAQPPCYTQEAQHPSPHMQQHPIMQDVCTI